MPHGKIIAWIEQKGSDRYQAAFVGGAATQRLPATQECTSHDDARQWIEAEADALGVPIQWVQPADMKLGQRQGSAA